MPDSTTTPAGDGADTAQEHELDYRFTMANERTFLSWQRTALGLLAAAVALVQLVPELGIPGARRLLGVGLALLAILTSGRSPDANSVTPSTSLPSPERSA